MAESYSPIMRTFCQFRACVLTCIDIDRHAIRTGTPLEALLPESIRRGVWDHLRRQGLRLPPLEFSERDTRRHGLVRAQRDRLGSLQLAELGGTPRGLSDGHGRVPG